MNTNENRYLKIVSTIPRPDLQHMCGAFLPFHASAIARDSIRLNRNQIDYIGLFSQKQIMHGKEVAIMPKLHSSPT
jgi:hypothetical protein